MSRVTVSAIVEADPRVGPTTRRTGHTSFAWSDSPPSRLVECGKTRLADHRLNTRIAACRTFPDTGGGAACDLSDARPRALRPRGGHRVGTTREHGNSPAGGAPRGPGQGHPLRSRSRPNAAVQQAVALLSRPSDQLRRPGSRHNWTLCCWGGPPTHSHSSLHHAQVSPGASWCGLATVAVAPLGCLASWVTPGSRLGAVRTGAGGGGARTSIESSAHGFAMSMTGRAGSGPGPAEEPATTPSSGRLVLGLSLLLTATDCADDDVRSVRKKCG